MKTTEERMTSCKDKSKVEIYYNRTAGVLKIMRSCDVGLGNNNIQKVFILHNII